MVSKYVDGRDTYISVKEELNDIINDLAVKNTEREVQTFINTGDNHS